MKVILLRDVAKIGRKNSVVDLPDGYALNQLIPKKWAEAATPANLKKIANSQANTAVLNQNDQARFDAAVELVSTSPLIVVAGQANEQGHLFKAVHDVDIVLAAKKIGAVLEPREVIIENPIKSLGTHTIVVQKGNQKVSCVVEVIKNI